MKMKNVILGIITGAALLFAANVNAAIINLGQADGSPADAQSQLDRLNIQINIYNAANNPDLAAAVLLGALTGQANGSGVLNINVDVTGWSYLVLKWANTDQFYYLNGATGVVNFASTVFNGNGQPQGLSGYSLFNPGRTTVPDGGSSVLMLGAALSGLSLVVRRLKK
jgi:hypothetical protein